MTALLRYCAANGLRELDPEELQPGMDFRLPQHRRATFLRFYEFHLMFKGHPGCVYYTMPYLAERYGWDMEQKLWFAFLNGNTQNPVTSWLIFREFPDFRTINMARLQVWFRENYAKLAFDTDRRYHKKALIQCIEAYKRLARGDQQAMFNAVAPSADGEANFRSLWRFCNDRYPNFGRLSVFSYLEYLRIMGVEVDCDQLFLEDMSGSKSHRNGLCKVLGRDDLDWHDSNPGFDGNYGEACIEWLKEEAALLRAEARGRFVGQPYFRDVGYFTMESALCTYKSWHRKNRRYPNVYNDMLVDRIRKAEETWNEPMTLFWDARRAALPEPLRLEDNPDDPGVEPRKQNHYRETGEVVMMDYVWPCFRNSLIQRCK